MKKTMKKSLAWVLILMMVVSVMAVMPISANEASPVKAYAAAQDGELLYTANFKGDSAFQPGFLASANNQTMTYTPSDDGKALTIKGESTTTDKALYTWGGAVAGLEVNANTFYSIKYLVKANGEHDGTNNSIGVGGWFPDVEGGKFYNNYSNHSSLTVANRRSSVSNTNAKLSTPQKADSGSYVYWNDSSMNDPIGNYKVDADGFVTMMMEFDGATGTMSAYILKANGTNGLTKDQWICLEKDVAMDAGIKVDGKTAGMGFGSYAYYKVVDSTVKNFEIYRGTVYGHNGIKVGTAAELAALGETLASRGEAELVVELTADIDMNGVAFTPISTDKGIIFDGKNFAIKNLTIGSATEGVENAGLFATVGANSIISNVKITDAAIYGSNAAGALVGNYSTYGDITFYNVKVTGNVTSLAGPAGGIIGINTPNVDHDDRIVWTFEYCVNEANVTAFGPGAGGLIGFYKGGIELHANYCANKGTIKVTNTTDVADHVGGLLGHSWYNKHPTNAAPLNHRISNCYNTGTLIIVDTTTVDANMGGLVANFRYVRKDDAADNGGYLVNTAHFSNCYDYSARNYGPGTATKNDQKHNALAGTVANGETKERFFTNCFAVNKADSATPYTEFFKVNSWSQTIELDCTGIVSSIDTPIQLTTGPSTVGQMIERLETAIAALAEVELPKGSFTDGQERDYTWYYKDGALVPKGTEAAPYEIANTAQFAGFAALAIGYQDAAAVGGIEGAIDFNGKYFKLTGDIDLTGYDLLPIGGSKGFSFVFDGAGKTISNLKQENAATGGLFANLGTGTIVKNLKLKGFVITAAGFAGTLAAQADSGIKLHNISNDETCSVTSTDYSGGIIGQLTAKTADKTSEFTLVANSASVTVTGSTTIAAGGIIGKIANNPNVTFNFKFCVNHGAITVNNTGFSGTLSAGGMFGTVAYNKIDSNFVLNVSDCYNNGKLSIIAATPEDDTQTQESQAHMGAVCGYLIAPGTLSFVNVYDNSERVVEPIEINSKYNASMCGWTTNAELMRTLTACYGMCDPASAAPYYGTYGYTTNGSMCNETNILVIDSATSVILNSAEKRSTLADEIERIDQCLADADPVTGEWVEPPPVDNGTPNGGNNNTEENTEPDYTTKPKTDKAPETTAAAEEEGGCGSSVVVMYVVIALTAVIALAFVAKKRED